MRISPKGEILAVQTSRVRRCLLERGLTTARSLGPARRAARTPTVLLALSGSLGGGRSVSGPVRVSVLPYTRVGRNCIAYVCHKVTVLSAISASTIRGGAAVLVWSLRSCQAARRRRERTAVLGCTIYGIGLSGRRDREAAESEVLFRRPNWGSVVRRVPRKKLKLAVIAAVFAGYATEVAISSASSGHNLRQSGVSSKGRSLRRRAAAAFSRSRVKIFRAGRRFCRDGHFAHRQAVTVPDLVLQGGRVAEKNRGGAPRIGRRILVRLISEILFRGSGCRFGSCCRATPAAA